MFHVWASTPLAMKVPSVQTILRWTAEHLLAQQKVARGIEMLEQRRKVNHNKYQDQLMIWNDLDVLTESSVSQMG
jgi:hypothetical protein